MTTRNKCLSLSIALLISYSFCGATNKNENSAYPIHFLNEKLTEILINDGHPPPIASRAYAYPNISAYITLAETSGKEDVLNNVLIDFPHVQGADKLPKGFSPSVASAYSFYYLSKRLIYTIPPFEDSFKVLLSWYKTQGYSDEEISNSQKVAKDYTDQFIKWIGKDHFAEEKLMPEYVLDDSPGHWTPTYPSYMPGLDPYWGTMRTLIGRTDKIDLSKFSALPYETTPNSALYSAAMEVSKIVTATSNDEKAIADFWDCNAFAVYPNGHMMQVIKKISPGGHWIFIAKNAAQVSHADLLKSEEAYALTSVAIFDAFINAWRLKYKYKTMRPETYLQINGADPDFRPYLQSPPFPEYLSAHAVVSMAAATVLTRFYGPSFHFTDNTENYLGLPSRSFNSFNEAATEAAISRYYGGIHYKYSCMDGLRLGAMIGDALLSGITK